MATPSSSTGRSENAFQVIARSVSSPTPQGHPPYDVFINHRGPDVKLTVASIIYHVLRLQHVNAFLDKEELSLGEQIPPAIENAMRTAQIHIAIFSKCYAESPWCLAELSFMIKTGAPIIPVFYGVKPDDLRRVRSRGAYTQAFRLHQEQGRYKSETLDEWKNALVEASNTKGYEFNSNDEQGPFYRDIVSRVLQEIIKNAEVPFKVADPPLGMDDAVKGFQDAIDRSPEIHHNAQIVGIVGMAGCGKTTLARELYNRKFKTYDKSTFLSEIREAALPELQKKLLEDLLHLGNIPFKNADDGKSILAGRLRTRYCRRVLIVLDGVDQVDQLDTLLPDKGRSLGSDSLVIVTTRDSRVLRSWGISSVYPMTKLDLRHGRALFCRHAFKEKSPPDHFEDLINKFVCACDGLPLSIKVIAASLFNVPKEIWESELKKIERLFPNDIMKKLQPSYDALDEEEKNIFLDVACFFVGEKETLAMAVWDAAEWSGLQRLKEKCLVEVDEQNRIRMQNPLRHLGRHIAKQRFPHRVWSPKQIPNIQRCGQEIRGIMAATSKLVVCAAHKEFPECEPWQLTLERMQDLETLQLLVAAGDYFNSDFGQQSIELVWLRFFKFQRADLSWLSLQKLRVLELYGASSFLQLWENVEPPRELREMIITAAEGNIFDRFPSKLSGLGELKKIALIPFTGQEFLFEKLPDEICDLQSLEHLELRYCTKLSILPDAFGQLRNLRHLDLFSCKELVMLPDSFQQLPQLKYLDLSHCKWLGTQEDFMDKIIKLTNLQNLYLSGHVSLQRLPDQITNQISLRELELQSTSLQYLPNDIGQLSNLEVLTIGSSSLTSLPNSLGNLSSLKRLSLANCHDLECLPETIGSLELLEDLCLESTGVSSIPGMSRLVNLRMLKISDLS